MGKEFDYIRQSSDKYLAEMLRKRILDEILECNNNGMPLSPTEVTTILETAADRIDTYGIIIKDLREQLEALKPKEFCHENFE